MYGDDDGNLAALYVQQVTVPEQEGMKVPDVGRKASRWVTGRFIQGPIPLSWLGRACGLGSQKAICTALAIWYLYGLKMRNHDLSLTSATLKPFGVLDRSSKKRALDALEKAGLIRVDRGPGRNPLVTILEVAT